MEEIDKQFRPKWDFFVVWVALTGAAFVFRGSVLDFLDETPWPSGVAVLILLPFLATFSLYGPVLLLRQVLQSGFRGRVVLTGAYNAASRIATALMLFGGSYVTWRIRRGSDS